MTGCPQAVFVVCPAPFLTETKSYGETEETGHLQTQRTQSHYKQDLQVTSRGRSNINRTQLICIGTTEKGLTKWCQLFVK